MTKKNEKFTLNYDHENENDHENEIDHKNENENDLEDSSVSNEEKRESAKKKHHSGPVNIQYVVASNVRSKTKFIRRKTLFKKVFIKE